MYRKRKQPIRYSVVIWLQDVILRLFATREIFARCQHYTPPTLVMSLVSIKARPWE